jgi:hypothetical protein
VKGSQQWSEKVVYWASAVITSTCCEACDCRVGELPVRSGESFYDGMAGLSSEILNANAGFNNSSPSSLLRVTFDALKHRNISEVDRMAERLVRFVTRFALAIGEPAQIYWMLKRDRLRHG